MEITDFNFDFNVKKTVNAVLYIVGKIQRKDFHKIFKILYFSDRTHLIKYGRPITGDAYIAMDDGPVPSKLYDIFKAVRGDSYYEDESFSKYFSVENWDLIKANQEADLRALSKTDKDILDENIEHYGNMSWDEIREKSHDYAWRSTVKNRPILFENIFTEAGSNPDFINYAREQAALQNFFRNL